VPVERMDRETVEMYAQDRRARAQDVFLPLRRLCGRRHVSRVVTLFLLTAATKVPTFINFAAAPPILSPVRASQVETVVLEGDSVVEALVRYAAESGVRSLVLGSSSLSWFRR
jgi:hypothetical protein